MDREEPESKLIVGVRESSEPDAIKTFDILRHELLSPLTLIKGYTGTLLHLDKNITEEQRKQYLRGIDSAINRVIRLLENLRDITYLEEIDSIATFPISLSQLLEQVLPDIQKQTTEHFINFHPHHPLPLVNVDGNKIDQVIHNLLDNAIKYSPKGGNIDITIQAVRTKQELESLFPDAPMISLPSLVVSVADSGIGIPKKELNRIFTRFYRVETELTRSIYGAGLGLYICKLIVEAHGGNIWARNCQKKGSIFFFSIPGIQD